MTTYSRTYMGLLTVRGNWFVLTAEKLIVRARDEGRTDIFEVAFDMQGHEEGSRFSLGGIAKREAEGRYVSPLLPVRYEGYGEKIEAEAEIVILRVVETKGGCDVGGEYWYTGEEGECGYRFEGFLEPVP